MPAGFIDGVLLLFVLLNPFLMTVYLLDLIRTLDGRTFARVLTRACAIAGSVYSVFALTGDAVFDEVLRVRFSAFIIFGGALFFVIGLQYVMQGPEAIGRLRGPPEHIAGSIAMPFMVGPATLSACVVLGSELPAWAALVAIACALALVILVIVVLKLIHDRVRSTNEPLVARYVDIVGRVSALIIGSIAVDMILRGIEMWQAHR